MSKVADFIDGGVVGFGAASLAFGWWPVWVGVLLIAVGVVSYVGRLPRR